jgi:hypothetical protein
MRLQNQVLIAGSPSCRVPPLCTTAVDRAGAVRRMVQVVPEGWDSRPELSAAQALSNQQGVN